MKIKDLPLDQRPREKAISNGIDTLSDQELLMVILGYGTKKQDVSKIANQILKVSEGLVHFPNLSMERLMEIEGIKLARAVTLSAILELSKRIYRAKAKNLNVIENPKTLTDWLIQEIGPALQEQFMVVYLNVRQEILHHEILFKGTLDRSLVHPREIFKKALENNAAAMIVVHNHPAGSLVPSSADLAVTEKLIKTSRMMEIVFLDHIIVTRNGYTSILNRFKSDKDR